MVQTLENSSKQLTAKLVTVPVVIKVTVGSVNREVDPQGDDGKTVTGKLSKPGTAVSVP